MKEAKRISASRARREGRARTPSVPRWRERLRPSKRTTSRRTIDKSARGAAARESMSAPAGADTRQFSEAQISKNIARTLRLQPVSGTNILIT
jgi:hypothetical protein